MIYTLAQTCRGYAVSRKLSELNMRLQKRHTFPTSLYFSVMVAKLLDFALLYNCRLFEHAYIKNCGSGFFEDILFDVSFMNLEQVSPALTYCDFIGFRILC